MKKQLHAHEWVAIEPEIKEYLRDRFKIGKSTGTTIINNEVKCDGTTDDDLLAMDMGSLIISLKDKLKWYKEDLFVELVNMAIDDYYDEIDRKKEEAERIAKEEQKKQKGKKGAINKPEPIKRWKLTL